MQRYTQIKYAERKKIAMLRNGRASIRMMAEELGRSPATISRELRRNEAPPGQYWPDTAQARTQKRRKRGCKIDQHRGLAVFIERKLCYNYWTPEQIAGHLKVNQSELPYVSHETIYSWIYASSQRNKNLWTYLPRRKKTRVMRKRKAKGQVRIIPNRTSIHQRPKVVDNKRQFGHWEGDLMSCIKGSEHMLVLRERATMFTLSVILPGKHAASTAQNISKLLEILPANARKTLTLDNGGEFAKHKDVADALALDTYFCDPYKSWQKGGVENTNGRLRRDIPRNTNLKSMPQEEFDEIINNYNTTPRKSLGWQTPQQVFMKKCQRVALRA